MGPENLLHTESKKVATFLKQKQNVPKACVEFKLIIYKLQLNSKGANVQAAPDRHLQQGIKSGSGWNKAIMTPSRAAGIRSQD